MRQGWHWIAVTDPQVRAQIWEFYRRSAEPYLASAAAADPSRATGSGIMGRVGSSSAYLAQHMGEVPVLVIPCITVQPAWPALKSQARPWGLLLPAAWSYMLACRSRGARHRLDHAAPEIRDRDRRAARAPRWHPPGRADPHGLLHRRDLPGWPSACCWRTCCTSTTGNGQGLAVRAARSQNGLDQIPPGLKAPPSVQDAYISTRRTRKAACASAWPSPGTAGRGSLRRLRSPHRR